MGSIELDNRHGYLTTHTSVVQCQRAGRLHYISFRQLLLLSHRVSGNNEIKSSFLYFAKERVAGVKCC